ncbi:hypothetical protein Tco_1446947 [Tanacetum coccineum]
MKKKKRRNLLESFNERICFVIIEIIEDWVSDDKDDVEPIPKVEKKTVIPTATKKEFVKPKKPVRRSVRPIFEKEMKEVSKESGAKRKKSLPRKSTRGTVKRQKIEVETEKEDLKGYLDIVPREEFAEA